MPMEARGTRSLWSYRQLDAAWNGCWEIDAGPVPEQYMLLSVETPPHPLNLNFIVKGL